MLIKNLYSDFVCESISHIEFNSTGPPPIIKRLSSIFVVVLENAYWKSILNEAPILIDPVIILFLCIFVVHHVIVVNISNEMITC